MQLFLGYCGEELVFFIVQGGLKNWKKSPVAVIIFHSVSVWRKRKNWRKGKYGVASIFGWIWKTCFSNDYSKVCHRPPLLYFFFITVGSERGAYDLSFFSPNTFFQFRCLLPWFWWKNYSWFLFLCFIFWVTSLVVYIILNIHVNLKIFHLINN